MKLKFPNPRISELPSNKFQLLTKKLVDFPNLKGVAQKLSPPRPFEFGSINGSHGVNFEANDFYF